MKQIVKKVPVWIKAPALVVFKEIRQMPLALVIHHTRCSYVDNAATDDATKLRVHQNKQRSTYQYLEKKYGKYIKQRSKQYDCGQQCKNFPVWLFWWQGESNAPDLVKRCISSIRKHAAGHPVFVVTESNYQEFVHLPSHIIEKLQSGKISLTHFSDILRMNLIADHGGFWLDATIFCTKDFTGTYFALPVFCGKNPNGDLWNISRWEWTGYAIYGWKNGALFCLARDLFNIYWQEHNQLIDYFLIDYIIRLIYNHVPMVAEQINAIPPNNKDIYYFQTHFNDAYCGSHYWNVLSGETWMYKLTWKTIYATSTEDGKDTVYTQWCRDNELESV